MTPEQWQRIKQLLAAALEREPAERAAFLSEACAGDAALKRTVESYLAAYADADSFIEAPAFAGQQSFASAQPSAPVEGRVIGHYKLLRELDHGGMGTVYLAVRADDEYQQQVAIKLVKRGMDTDFVLSRFRHERQLLAGLEHPNIARLLDGGTTDDGLPYFVMEYVAGIPIDKYCDTQRLNTVARLKLFRSVCAAVHYAHQNLIVHRDLKPSNILVTADGVPKLLDFGIAKLLSPDLSLQTVAATTPAVRLMTPEFASPEQVKGDPITTASDVYSLGVVLYELLTGHRPYRLKSRLLDDVARVICEEQPERPSTVINRSETLPGSADTEAETITPESVSRAREGQPDKLRRRLAGDLDNIVLMAMRKELQRRYGSVEQFSDDIRRHLEGLPVLARKDAVGYRTGKFIRRHVVGVAAAALLAATLIAGIITTTWQARVARAQRNLAVRAANSMINDLAAGLEKMVGPTESRLRLLSQAAVIYDEIDSQGYSTPELQRQAADGNRVLARTYRTLGDKENALRRATTAERQARALVARMGATLQDQSLLAATLVEFGDALQANDQNAAAVAAYNESRALSEKVVASAQATPAMRANLSIVLLRIADRLYYEGKLPEAEATYRRGLEIDRALTALEPDNTDWASVYATDTERLGDVLYAEGVVDQSCAAYRAALDVRRHAAERVRDEPMLLRTLAIAMQNVGWCLEQEVKVDDALKLYDESIAIEQRLLHNDPANTVVATNLMGGLATKASTLMERGQLPAALDAYREAFRLGERLRTEGKTEARIGAQTAAIAQLLAQALIKEEAYIEAADVVSYSIKLQEELMTADPANLDYPRKLLASYKAEGDLLCAQHRCAEGVKRHRQALALCQRVVAATGTSEDKQLESDTYYQLGRSLQQDAQPTEAHAAFLAGRQILLDLRAAGQLSDTAEGFRIYLPQLQKALGEKNSIAQAGTKQ